MFQTIKLYSDLGLNAIVDHVFEKSFFESELKSLDECIEILHEYPVLFIHVTCPIQELRRREKARGDRQIGQAESQLSTLVPQDTEIYDITIDTHEYSSRECTDKIIEMLGYPKKHKAFKTLWLQSSMVQKAARQGCRALRTR